MAEQKLNTGSFELLTAEEIQYTDGGFVICGVTIAGATLMGWALGAAGAGFAAGIAVGVCRKSR